jgi:predicted dehydrogenase
MGLGIGIIGAGGISRAHAEGYQKLGERAKLVAVADIDAARASQAAKTWGAEHALEDYQDLLALDAVDAVSVCTFNQAHCAPTVAALEAGKHVLVEKPMAATLAEAERMAAAAKANGRLLMVDMKWRFMPEILAARAFVAAGNLGQIYYAEALGWQQRGIPGGSFIRQDMAGGGALMDNGVYTLDAALFMLGHPQPRTVSGTAANTFGASPDGSWDAAQFSVEDFGSAYVRLDGGVTLYFAHAWAVNFEDQWLVRIAGSRGSVELRPFGPGPKLILRRGGYTDLAQVEPELPEGSTEISYAVERFVEAIESGADSPVPADTFLYTNVVFDGLYRSSRLGREVEVEVPRL